MPGLGLDPNISSVGADDFFANCQAQACAAPGVPLNLYEFIENPRLLLVGNARTVVTHVQIHPAPALGRYRDLVPGVSKRIAQQIRNHPGDLI